MSTTKQKYLFVIIGPTAVGKTDLCVYLANKLNAVVVSADSRQFYKEMSIGTAKPSVEEMLGIPHYFINNKSIEEDFNVGKYEKEVISCLDNIFSDFDSCILTGGSGLYIDAVCEGIDDMPKIPSSFRVQLNNEYEQNGLTPLVKELKQHDPEYYSIVDLKNPQRVIRALEVCQFTGKPYTTFRKNNVKSRPFRIIKIGLERDRDELYKRIDMRMDEMIKKGLFEEAEKLFPYRKHNALQTVGYKEIFDFLDERYDKEEAIRLLKRNSRRYAKRQMTWFRRYDDIEWFHPENTHAIEAYIENKMDDVK